MKHLKLLSTLAAGLMALSATSSTINENKTPVHRPLIEEYTGTWCGWCVRGLVGMELMRETFGDDFIGVAYHYGDPMQITTSYPNNVSGFPSAFVERSYSIDPLYGFDYYATGDIIGDMQQIAAMEAIAGIDVTANWTSADRTAIDVNVTSYFTSDYSNANFAIEIMLIADDLYGTGSSWDQANYYSGDTDLAKDEYLGPWVRKPSTVSGIHFNDVLVGLSGVIANSLPTSIVAYNDYTTSYTFQLERLPKPALIQNKDNLHVIAIAVYKDKRKAINANRCYISDYVQVTPGDVNNDGKISIDDVTALIDMLLSNSETNDNADVDGNGHVAIDDVTALIDLLLGSAN